MPGLVSELQRDALDKNIDVTNLLRKALVVSKKLGIREIEEWINWELSGYPADKDFRPEYRVVHGQVMVLNPFHGWESVLFEDPEMGKSLSSRTIIQPVSELVALVKNDNSGFGEILFSHETKNKLMDLMSSDLEPIFRISIIKITGILDSVRNEILNWALELEAKGIVGPGMSFSIDEKRTASQVTYQITNNIGSMQNSQLQQDSAGASQTQTIDQSHIEITEFVNELKSSMTDLNLDTSDYAELEAEVLTLENQLASPKPKSVIINESLKSARSILESIASNALTTGLLSQLAAFF